MSAPENLMIRVLCCTQYLDPVLRESCGGAHDEAHVWYSVYAVVEHTGSLKGGHYVAYVRVDESARADVDVDVLCVLERCQLLLQEKDLLSLRKLLELYLHHTRREHTTTTGAHVPANPNASTQPQASAPVIAPASASACAEQQQQSAALRTADDGVVDTTISSITSPAAVAVEPSAAASAAATETAHKSDSSRWFYVSDSLVQPVSAEKAFAAQAYLLFYQRL